MMLLEPMCQCTGACKTQKISDLCNAPPSTAQVALGQIGPDVEQDLSERRRFSLQPSVQGPPVHAKKARHLVGTATALRQQRKDHLTGVISRTGRAMLTLAFEKRSRESREGSVSTWQV